MQTELKHYTTQSLISTSQFHLEQINKHADILDKINLELSERYDEKRPVQLELF
jgi:hypothetical protein